jgi:hypothetical protein
MALDSTCGFGYEAEYGNIMLRTGHLQHKARVVAPNFYATSHLRGPGEANGMAVIEAIVDRVAAELGADPTAVREANMRPVPGPGGALLSACAWEVCAQMSVHERECVKGRTRTNDDYLVLAKAVSFLPTSCSLGWVASIHVLDKPHVSSAQHSLLLVSLSWRQ